MDLPLWAQIIIAILLAGAAILSLWDRLFSERSKKLDSADDRLISLQKETVNEQDRRIKELEKQQTVNMQEIARLTGENNVMAKLLQGRDNDTVAFREAVLTAIKIGNETHALVKSLADSSEKHGDEVKSLYQLLEKHLRIGDITPAPQLTLHPGGKGKRRGRKGSDIMK